MTRKDFELIARTIKAMWKSPASPAEVKHTAVSFADALEKHSGNANFDRDRFLKACGVAVQSDAG